MLMKSDKAVGSILAKINEGSDQSALSEQNAEALESNALQGGGPEDFTPEAVAAEEMMAAIKSGSQTDMLEAFEAMFDLLMAKRGR